MTRRVFTGLGALAAVQAVASCSGSRAGSSGTGNRNAAASEVRDLVRMSPPSFDGVDLGHVGPDPSEVEGTVATATMDPSRRQCLFLWEEGKVPATTTPNGSGYDPVGFRPTGTSVPTAASTAVKGAVLLCAGGAFALRGDNSGCYPTARRLSALGYHCFVVDYRVRPYTQAEACCDLARAIRFVRAHTAGYGLPSAEHIALGGYSAGGILCGETILSWTPATYRTILTRSAPMPPRRR